MMPKATKLEKVVREYLAEQIIKMQMAIKQAIAAKEFSETGITTTTDRK